MKRLFPLALLAASACATVPAARMSGTPRVAAPPTAPHAVPDAPFRQAPPFPAESTPFAPKKVALARLRNGIRVVMLPDSRAPSVIVGVMLNAAGESDHQASVVRPMLESLMVWGASGSRKSGEEVRDFEVAHLMTASSTLHFDALTIREHGLGSDLPSLLALLSARVRSPALTPAALDFGTRIRQNAFQTWTPEASAHARYVLDYLVGRTAPPTFHIGPADVVTLDELRLLHAKMLDPTLMLIAAAGHFDEQALVRGLEETFGQISKPTSGSTSPTAAKRAVPRVRVLVLDVPGRSEIGVAFGGIPVELPALGAEDPFAVASGVLEARTETSWRESVFAQDPRRTAYVTLGRIRNERLLAGAFTIPSVRLGASLDALQTKLSELHEAVIPEAEVMASLPRVSATEIVRYATVEATERTLESRALAGAPLPDGLTQTAPEPTALAAAVTSLLHAVSEPAAQKLALVGDASVILPILKAHGLGESVEVIRRELR